MEKISSRNDCFKDEINNEATDVPVDTDAIDSSSKIIDETSFCTKRNFCIVSFILVSLLGAAISGSIVLAKKATSTPSKTKNNLDTNSQNTIASDSESSSEDNVSSGDSVTLDETRRGTILSFLEPYFRSDDEPFPSSLLQAEAFDWISDEDTWTISSSSIVEKDVWLERYTTSILYFATEGKQWKDANLWLTDHNHCDWKGIECNKNGQIETIDLFYGSLSGMIPSELGMLTMMTSLALKHNQLSGTIPTEIGTLSGIETIDISYNNLTGMIPSELGKLIRLDSLELSHNSLSGTTPLELENLARAGTHVYLGRNFDIQDCNPSILICP